MQDMLMTSLFDTKRFIVLEREQLGAVMAEQDRGVSLLTPHTSGALGTYAGTPMEQAICNTISAAVDFVASQTPAEYYAHR